MATDAYKKAGVDVEAGYESVRLIKNDVKRTAIEGVLGGIGGFGGLFEIPKGYENPVLVSGTDGVGTKLRIAFLMDKHDTIGQDCVAMCVNDVACSGAKPLFFLDYLAVGKNYPERIAEIVKGVADGCVKAGCALVGGETAEMPGFYPEDEYDLAGFSVGVVEKDKITDGNRAKAGDKLIGIASSGVHSNGYSLVRTLFDLNGENAKANLSEYSDKLGSTIGEALLTPTRIYVKPLLKLIDEVGINTVSHITGGGFYENIPRMLPDGLKAVVHKGTWNILPIFDIMQEKGNIPEDDMYNTFNMGLGMIVAVDADKADAAVKCLEEAGEKADKLDIGFRVLKLDSSNMNDVYYTPEKFSDALFTEDNVKEDRTSEDLLFQTMLDLGIELSANIETKQVNGKNVHYVDGNYLIACFDKDVNESTIKEIAKEKPIYFVMRDASASTDNVIDNFDQIFKYYSPETKRRII